MVCIFEKKKKKKQILNVFFISFYLFNSFFTTYGLPHQLNIYVVYWIWLKIVQISQNAIWSNNTYAIVAQFVWDVSPGMCVCGGGGGGGRPRV